MGAKASVASASVIAKATLITALCAEPATSMALQNAAQAIAFLAMAVVSATPIAEAKATRKNSLAIAVAVAAVAVVKCIVCPCAVCVDHRGAQSLCLG